MRGVRWLVVLLVVVAGLLLIADRVGAWVTGRVVADQVAQELASAQVDTAPPEVTVHGFPFLTQVAAGRYESVTLRLRDVGTGAARLPVVDLTATGVNAPASTLVEGSGPIHADRVVGTAVIGYATVADLSDLDGLELSATADGSLRVRLPAELLGVPLVLAGTADVEVAGDVIRVRARELSVESPDDGLPAGAEALVDDLLRAITMEVTLPPLPYGLAVEGVAARPSGLAVTLSARDVPLVS